MYFEGQSVARSLRDGGADTHARCDGLPIEWPEEIRRPNPLRWVGLAAFAIVGATGILIGSGVGTTASVSGAADLGTAVASNPGAGDLPPAPVTSSRALTYAVPVDGVPALGRADAKVTVVAVTEYGCTACEQAREVLAKLRAQYGDDLRVVYKPFVTMPAAPSLLAACAAARQGQFVRLDDAVWRVGVQRSKQLAIPLALPDAPALEVIARDIGLDMPRYTEDVASCDFVVRTSRTELDALRVSAPAYFVNGKLLEGPQAIAALPVVVSEELVRAEHRIGGGTTRDRYYQEWVIDLGRTSR